MLAATRTLTRRPNSPLRPENLRLATVVLSTTGLRRGELTRLTVGDYDPPQRTLAIRESKFHKSRLVPLSADTAREIEHLIELPRPAATASRGGDSAPLAPWSAHRRLQRRELRPSHAGALPAGRDLHRGGASPAHP